MTTWQTIRSWRFFILNFQLFRKADEGPKGLPFIHSILGQWKNNCTNFSIRYAGKLLLIILTFLFAKTSSKPKWFFWQCAKKTFCSYSFALNKDFAQASGWRWLHCYMPRGTQSGSTQCCYLWLPPFPISAKTCAEALRLTLRASKIPKILTTLTAIHESWIFSTVWPIWLPFSQPLPVPHLMENTWFSNPTSLLELGLCHPPCWAPSLWV